MRSAHNAGHPGDYAQCFIPCRFISADQAGRLSRHLPAPHRRVEHDDKKFFRGLCAGEIPMSINVYAFGSALVDIQLAVDDTLLAELELQRGNMYLTDRVRQEQVLEKILGGRITDLGALGDRVNLAAGGSAANTVYGIVQLGGTAALCGKVASDPFGHFYIRDIQQGGVLFNQKMVEGMTGTCIVLISDDAQRTMLTCLAVSSEITYEDLNEDYLKNSTYLYIEGYLFDSAVATETVLRAIATAKKHTVNVALSASDSFCIERHKDQFLRLVKNDVDLLFANAQEAQALTDTDSLEDACRVLPRWCRQCAITDGARGSTLLFNGERLKINPYPVIALDTTGAGDAYAAGLLFGLTNGYSLEQSGKIASFFSSRVVFQLGPRFAGDIRQEIKELELS